MIPIRLSLRNFMSYRDNIPPLYFNGIHTACISGDNGNGKSSLIDAITWALWGKTRAKSDDDLVNQGETEMEVEFDFAVGDQGYRVIRKHAKPKQRNRSGQTILEFQIDSGDGYKPITGTSIAETQRDIIARLHMDYETFINSAYLMQGHADEFTLRRPVERKEVLASILGLEIYDELEERAKEMARQQALEKAQLERNLVDIAAELANQPTYQKDYEQAQSELSGVDTIIKESEATLNTLRLKKETLENKRVQVDQLRQHVANTKRELERREHEIKQHQARLQEFAAIIAQRTAIEAGYAQLVAARQQCDELNRKLALLNRLNQRKHELDMTITRAGQKLLQDHAIAQNRINELSIKAQQIPQLQNELLQAQTQQKQLTGVEETLRQKRQAGQELQVRIHFLESSRTQLQQQITELEEKLTLLSGQSGAKCPLCESEIGEEGIQHIETKYLADKASHADSLQSNQIELDNNNKELQLLTGEISQLETQVDREKATVQGKAGVVNQAIKDAEQAAGSLTEERQKLAEIEQHLARKDFAATEQQALTELEAEIAGLNYDSQQHEQSRNRLTDLEHHESAQRKLEEADRLLTQEKEAVARAEEAAQELRQNLETDIKTGQAMAAEVNTLPQLIEELTRAETEYQSQAARQKQAQETSWRLQARLQNCAELEITKQEKEKQHAQAAREEGIYLELAQAFGKKGIQALLIESALPEIELEANRLLGRMTDNRMHVKIETQRETKKGDTVETLDINIADELGTRNYEMFSGGEAFRINFAIRIALSRLLARRAGAPLPTLIIDEGFGTQDEIGIEKIKEAISSIQDDFEKILVITHIEELRDAFPTRINVTKNDEGSMIEVI